MPSSRATDQRVKLAKYDAVGWDGKEQYFISHVALAQLAGNQEPAGLNVLDMGPPLHGQGRSAKDIINAVGSVPLTDDEANTIKMFIERQELEHIASFSDDPNGSAKQIREVYCIHPHAETLLATNGDHIRTRFSCAGFVYESYKAARITLFDINGLPKDVDDKTIESLYSVQLRMLMRYGIELEDLGLEGNGPWPVMLCGYLFHALNRSAEEIRCRPYEPTFEDRYFPHQPTATDS